MIGKTTVYEYIALICKVNENRLMSAAERTDIGYGIPVIPIKKWLPCILTKNRCR
ncbi:hypothetical protein GCM10023078_38210 [Gibbsiella greigii]